jgi:uncharacterized protein YbjT (DUF2867 family)
VCVLCSTATEGSNDVFLVAGATGVVGGEVVRALLRDGQPVRGLTRTGGEGRVPDGAEVAVGDLNTPASLTAALRHADGVFLLAGYDDMPGLLTAVKDAGAGHVVLLSSGAVEGGSMSNAVVRYNAESEAAVRESGVPWTILRPSGFMSNTFRWRQQLEQGDVVREAFASVPIASIDPYDIGAVAAAALTEPGHAGRTYRLTGPQPLLPADRLRLLGEALGRELHLEAISDSDARREMEAAMPKQYVDAFFDFFVDGSYDDAQVLPTVEEITARRARTFELWLGEHADAFR